MEDHLLLLLLLLFLEERMEDSLFIIEYWFLKWMYVQCWKRSFYNKKMRGRKSANANANAIFPAFFFLAFLPFLLIITVCIFQISILSLSHRQMNFTSKKDKFILYFPTLVPSTLFLMISIWNGTCNPFFLTNMVEKCRFHFDFFGKLWWK